jgi:hypothetical protein
MNNKNIIKLITSLLLISFLVGCGIKQVKTVDNNGNITYSDKIEEIVYKRPEVSELLKNRIRGILKTMAVNDLTKLNKEYIHPEFGFYNLFKIDGIKVFSEQKEIYNIIEEETEEVSHIISRVKNDTAKLKIIQKDVAFDCSPNNDAFYGWNDDGLFLSSMTDSFLSKMMNETNIYQKDKYKTKDFQKVDLIEKTSYKVVLTPEVSFYITKIDDNWYITLIDRITSDCSSIKE